MTLSTELPGLRQTHLPQGKHLGLQKPQDTSDDAPERPDFSGLMAAMRTGKPAAPAAEGLEGKPDDVEDTAAVTDSLFNGSFNVLTLQADRSIKAQTDGVPNQGPDRGAVEGEATDLEVSQTPIIDGTAVQTLTLTSPIETAYATQPSDQTAQAPAIGEAGLETSQMAFAVPAAPPPAVQPAPVTGSTLTRPTTVAEPAAAAVQTLAVPAKAKAQREPLLTGTSGVEAVKDQGAAQANPPAFSLASAMENRVTVTPRDGQAIAIHIQNMDAEAATVALPKTMPDAPQASAAQAQAFGGLMTNAVPNEQPMSVEVPQQIPEPVVISTTDPNWEVEFVDSIVAQVSGENAVIDLALTPDNLGKVEIRVELRDGRADVSFVTETREAARLFAQAEGRLSELMERHGLDLAGQNSSHRDGQARPATNTQTQHIDDREAASPVRIVPQGRVNLVA